MTECPPSRSQDYYEEHREPAVVMTLEEFIGTWEPRR